ncbi:MAG: hypothetical protein IPO35_07725 [Uliginosibacterium sp.]|nr:hypothetical protein [Uliginosibacterium sp.]
MSTYAKNLAKPGKMATDKKGKLYVIDGERILQVDSKGAVTTLANEPGRYLGGISVDMSDNVVYAVSSSTPDTMLRQSSPVALSVEYPSASFPL